MIDFFHVDNPDLRPEIVRPVCVTQLAIAHPTLRTTVIGGVLRRGEVANLIAAPKMGKSFLAGNLAWCAATGRPWMGFETTEGRVLIIDNELHPETLASRLTHIADAMMIDHTDRVDRVHCIGLRGRLCDIDTLSLHISPIEKGMYSLVVVDALYRTIPHGSNENSNADMMAIYNRLDQYAAQLDAAVVVVHHLSKGAQTDKAVTDLGAGAGSINRAADTIIAVLPHANDGHCVMELETRSFKAPEPLSISFDWPLWTATTLAPERKNHTQSKRETDDKEADGAILVALTGRWLSESQLVRSTGMGPSRVSRAIGRAVSRELVTRKVVKRQGRKVPVFCATATETATAEKIAS